MSETDVALCQCPCHADRTVVHGMPCCLVCEVCGATVRFSAMAAHQREHGERAVGPDGDCWPVMD